MLKRCRLQNVYPPLVILLLTISVLLLVSLWLAQPTFSETLAESWARRGLDGLVITNLVEDAVIANRLYATSRDAIGVRFSEDEGETWHPYGDGLKNFPVESLISCPSGWLVAGTWGDFVYRRTSTTTWVRSNSGLTQEYIPALACGTGSVIFAATYNKGVFRSDNHGANWQPINQGLTQLEVLSLVYTNGRLYAGTARGIFERQDSAASWQLVGLADRHVARLFTVADTLWAGTDQGVFRAALSSPTNWPPVGALAQVVLSIVRDGNQRLYAGTREGGIYRLVDGGWQPLNTGLTPKKIFVLRARGADQLKLLAGTEDGIWINQVQPVVTPAPIVTNTSTLTPTTTPIPTPGIKTIRLQNAPMGTLAGGEIVTYTIELANGPFALANVEVSNPLPAEMELVSNSISAPAAWTPSFTDRTISWARSTLPAGETARLIYRAQRHTPTVTPTPPLVVTEPTTSTATPTPTVTPTTATPSALPSPPTLTATLTPTTAIILTPTVAATNVTIAKTGPAAVAVGATIRYTLTVANHLTQTLTGLTIMDVIPVGAEVVDFGGGAMTMPPSPMMQWQVPSLSGQSVTTRAFAIRPRTATNQVINDLYFVDIVENGVLRLRVVGKAPIITTIIGGVLEPLPVALVSSTLPLTASLPIFNRGAVVSWQYPDYSNQLTSNSVSNPLQIYFPFIPHQ